MGGTQRSMPFTVKGLASPSQLMMVAGRLVGVVVGDGVVALGVSIIAVIIEEVSISADTPSSSDIAMTHIVEPASVFDQPSEQVVQEVELWNAEKVPTGQSVQLMDPRLSA